MGNRAMKTNPGAPSQENQRVDRDPASQPPSETSPGRPHARAQAHCIEVHISQTTHERTETYILVSPEAMEGEHPQDSGMTPSFAVTKIGGGANLAPQPAGSNVDTRIRTDGQPSGLDLLVEVCHLLPERSPEPPPETVSEDAFAAELSSIFSPPTGAGESWKETEDYCSSADCSYGTEGPECDQKVPCEVDVEFTIDEAQGAAEKQTAVQRELEEAASEGARRNMAELQPNVIAAESPDRCSIIVAAPGTERLAEGQSNAPVTEMEVEIPEDYSAAVSRKEREGLSPLNDISEETEFQNDQKVSCEMCLNLAADNSQLVVEEPTIMQRQPHEEPSSEKEADAEFHPDLVSVEASGGPSSGDSTVGMKQLPEEQSAPRHDYLVEVSEMEEVPSDCSAAENTGEITKSLTCHLKMLPLEAQDKMLTQGELRDETACPLAPEVSLEKDLEQTLTSQGLSTIQETPNTDVLLLGDVELLDASRPGEAAPTLEVVVPAAQTAVQAQPPKEVTVTQSSSEALLETTDTRKEREEAWPDQPSTEGTVAEGDSSGSQLPPETAALSGSTLQVAHGEEAGELVAGTAPREAIEIQAGTKTSEGQ